MWCACFCGCSVVGAVVDFVCFVFGDGCCFAFGCGLLALVLVFVVLVHVLVRLCVELLFCLWCAGVVSVPVWSCFGVVAVRRVVAPCCCCCFVLLLCDCACCVCVVCVGVSVCALLLVVLLLACCVWLCR